MLNNEDMNNTADEDVAVYTTYINYYTIQFKWIRFIIVTDHQV